MAEQTAVGCFIKELRQLVLDTIDHLSEGDVRLTQEMLDDFEEKYEQIEKQQIKESYLKGDSNGCGCYDYSEDADAEQYYNDTYKTQA